MDMTAIFPLDFASDEMRLLTAIVIGFFFGFALERGGFGNARKLAAQFYFYDMTVFKVMFTAIIVAMVGFYSLASIGLVDVSMMWINPTFIWAQLVGGFLLGVGFIMSGLCPGTSFVSAVSGRWDGWVTIGGIFVGTFAFAAVVDWFPGLKVLYEGGSMGVSVLYDVFNMPATSFAAIVVLVAAAGFLGAEMVEKMVSGKHEALPLAPVRRKLTTRLNTALVGGLASVAVIATIGWAPGAEPADPIAMGEIAPLDLADEIISDDPGLMILDVRDSTQRAEGFIPGAYVVGLDETALGPLGSADSTMTIVILFADGSSPAVAPPSWPTRLDYLAVRGGFVGWTSEVLTPATPTSFDAEVRALAARQSQISAFFTGSAVEASAVAAPPPVMSGGGGGRKKAGGC
jgi:uncharacterized membrane protein YedE/YeeE/rhodanese-related sulfurtransferase